MKIIYAFKHLEINVKQLLSYTYQDQQIKKLCKWDMITQFLRSKDIPIAKIHEYENINQLRILNNHFKHSDGGIGKAIGGIPEFKDVDVLHYIHLEKFYNRIKLCPKLFLQSLISCVFKDVYTFSYERIKDISTSFALRMEKSDALLLSSELLKHYD